MKKKPALFLLAFPVLLLAACGTNPNSSANASSSGQNMENQPFTDIGETESDVKYTFASSLAEKEPLYPLSKGQSYYFSSSSANNGDGSIESPFNSLDKLKGVTLQAGVSILFKCGDTFLGNIAVESIKGDDDNPITFASYGEGERPIIEGPSTIGDVDSLRSTVLFEKCSNIVVRDLKIKVYGPDRSAYPGNSYVGISFNYNFSKGEKFKNLYAINNVVEGNGVSSNTWGITLNSVESSPSIAPHKIVDNVNFKYNETYGFGRSGIHSGGWLNSSPKNGNNSFMDLFTNLHFDHNNVYETGTIGLYIVGCTNSTMNYNTIHDTGKYNVNQVMEGQCGIMALGTDHCEIKYNEIYNVYDQETGYDAMGIDIDWNTNDVDVMYNYCHDCQGPGIGTMANQNSFIQYNKIVNCHGNTNQPGAITVSNFTSRYECVADNMHAVKNLTIRDNLVIQNDSKTLFFVNNFNGDTDFEGDKFLNNHLIYTGDEVRQTYFVSIDPATPWYECDSNKYYSKDIQTFRVLDTTEASAINFEDGAVPFVFDRENQFGSWAKRDLHATYEMLSDALPSMPISGSATYVNGEIKLSWASNSKGGVWHYNVYDCKPHENVSYLNLLAEVHENELTFTPTLKGTHRYVIQPESDQGILGKAYILEVTL